MFVDRLLVALLLSVVLLGIVQFCSFRLVLAVDSSVGGVYLDA